MMETENAWVLRTMGEYPDFKAWFNVVSNAIARGMHYYEVCETIAEAAQHPEWTEQVIKDMPTWVEVYFHMKADGIDMEFVTTAVTLRHL